MNLNKAIIIGRLTRDPEVRSTPSGQQVANLGIATNRNWTNQQGEKQDFTEYHNVVLWGKLAEIVGQYLSKGRLVMIEGRLQTRSWEGQDGVKRYRTEIVAENMQMGPRPGESGSAPVGKESKQSAPPAEEIPTIQEDEPSQISSQESVDVENIPF